LLIEGTSDSIRKEGTEEGKMNLNCAVIQKYADLVYVLPGKQETNQTLEFTFSANALITVKSLIGALVVDRVVAHC
jgi:hypothetical protein